MLEIIISIISTATPLIIALITFIRKFCSTKSNYILAKNDNLLINLLPRLIEYAEQFKSLSGKEKKEYVISKVYDFCNENNIDIDYNYISDQIDYIVKLTRKVNFNG